MTYRQTGAGLRQSDDVIGKNPLPVEQREGRRKTNSQSKSEGAWSLDQTHPISVGVKVKECQTRWVRLRERYAREKRREFIENSSGETPVKKKEWYLLKDMEFLSPHVKRRKCFFIVPTNTSDNIEESNSANELEDSQPPPPSLPPPSLPPPSLPPPSPSSSTRSHLNILIRHPFRGGSFYVSMK
uniref:MADF domain-containing protein n=1 Tax=Timema bartmani TaxID=61472 RepID=A0A7R9F109_9NEOP|nr:unnamed protein product [Timema bartmani]